MCRREGKGENWWYRHLARNPDVAWGDIPDFPRAACDVLEQQFVRRSARVDERCTSSDGETTKLLITLQDGLKVEAVIMRYDTSPGAGAPLYFLPCACFVAFFPC